MLSHELRNPLAPIRNSVYILEHADPASEQAARARSVIQRQTDHLTRLVDDLLDVTRIARGKIDLRRERVDLRDLVLRTAEDLRSVVESRGITFRLDVPDERRWADADRTRIAQVIGNLLQNAAKFTRHGDTVSLALRAEKGAAEIVVRDTGAGIDPALLPKLFQPFVQGHRTLARTEGGLGLGLSLVKGIAELHGGTVRVESAGKGAGAEFVIRLPLAASAPTRQPGRASAAREGPQRRVLVVDDNQDAAESLAELVEMLGHSSEVAFDGPTAIAKARACSPDVVLCDIGLPGMSGYEVARAVRGHLANRVLLVALSGYARPEDLKAAVEAGFDRHVAKPASADAIDELLG
jgi:CheY-like chemotaxis protein/two-component sensor histidine kinase